MSRPPLTIDSLTDELLVRIFKLVPGYLPKVPELRNRLGLEQVCRRWSAVAASPAAAPSFKLIIVDATDDAAAMTKLARWFAVHGARVLRLLVFVKGADSGRSWTSTLPLLALAPHLRRLHLTHFDSPPPTGAEWWRHLGSSLTELKLGCFRGAGLERIHRRGGLPPSLACVDISNAGLTELPRALGDLTRLTRLRIFEGNVHEAPPAAYWQVLLRLATLRNLELDLYGWPPAPRAGYDSKLPAIPLVVSALANLTSLRVGSRSAVGALAAPGALDPLICLPCLERLEFPSAAVRQPSALTGLTALRELVLHVSEEDFRASGDRPLIEAGLHLENLRSLEIQVYRADEEFTPATICDVRRRVIEPLGAATALKSLRFARGYLTSDAKGPASFLLLTVDRIDDLVAGKPALRAFCAPQEMLLKVEEVGFPALRARHPHVEFEFDIQDDSIYRRWFC